MKKDTIYLVLGAAICGTGMAVLDFGKRIIKKSNNKIIKMIFK